MQLYVCWEAASGCFGLVAWPSALQKTQKGIVCTVYHLYAIFVDTFENQFIFRIKPKPRALPKMAQDLN